MKRTIALSLLGGVSPTVTTRSGSSCFSNFKGDVYYPMLGAMEIIDAKEKQTNSIKHIKK